jgi:F0F1-type ATP synthase alpha subunit
LKQDQYQPLTVEQQVLIIFAAERYLDDIGVAEAGLRRSFIPLSRRIIERGKRCVRKRPSMMACATK